MKPTLTLLAALLLAPHAADAEAIAPGWPPGKGGASAVMTPDNTAVSRLIKTRLTPGSTVVAGT